MLSSIRVAGFSTVLVDTTGSGFLPLHPSSEFLNSELRDAKTSLHLRQRLVLGEEGAVLSSQFFGLHA